MTATFQNGFVLFKTYRGLSPFTHYTPTDRMESTNNTQKNTMDLSQAIRMKIEAQRQKRLSGMVEIDMDVLGKEVRIWMFLDPKRMQQMIKEKRIKVDSEINREEVSKRPGNAESYGRSAENNTSMGQFAGHTNMPAEDVIRYALAGDLNSLATTVFPFLITEGGHRTRWLERLKEALSGNNRIALTILASTDEVSRKRHVSEEFQTLNLDVAPPRAGEVTRSIIHPELRKSCIEMLEALLNDFFPKTDKKRGNWSALCNSTINAIAEEDMSMLHLKASMLVRQTKETEITQSKHDAVIDMILKLRELFQHFRDASRVPVPKSQELTNAEAAVNTPFPKHRHLVNAEAALAAATTPRDKSAAKEVVKREKNVYNEAKKVALKNAKDEVKRLAAEHKEEEGRRSSIAKSVDSIRYELDLIGPILYGLMTEGDDAITAIKAWMNRLLVSREAYDRGMRLATESGTAARSYTEARYEQGWGTIGARE